MDWSDVLADSSLHNLPYKIELDQYGRILMSPASNRHARIQATLAGLCSRWFKDGVVFTECSVATAAGVRVPDVAWASPEFVARHGDVTPFPAAPDLCVEVVSPGNRAAEMTEKVALYLATGAEEVWLVSEESEITAYGNEGVRAASVFPVPFSIRLA